jgi:phospholipid/cholesterol/gamma-HCH transport system substrate-binding protein
VKRGALAVVVGLVLSGCGFFSPGGEERTYTAVFDRAIQLFPGGNVRVLGVDVGEIVSVDNVKDGVEVTFRVTDPDIQLPADVEAAIIPVSLLGERYIQLFPAYQGGPILKSGESIPLDRTAVPAEPDELLRSLQDYLGALDPDSVTRFVDNAAAVLKGNGERLNRLIEHAASVIELLSSRRDDLAAIIVQFDRLTRALATRQDAIANVIRTYNQVVGTLTRNRAALEGTIDGLNEMSIELASLIRAHRDPLGADIRTLTRTGRTIERNVHRLVRTGHWAERLFIAASNAIDYPKNWLRLNNQGAPLETLILRRLQRRLQQLCQGLVDELPGPIPPILQGCTTPLYWEQNVPSLFCDDPAGCVPKKQQGQAPADPVEEIVDAVEEVPTLVNRLLERARQLECADADDPARCVQRKEALVRCAGAANPRACLERQAVKTACPGEDSLKACLEQKQREDLEDLFEELFEDTLGATDGVGGLR